MVPHGSSQLTELADRCSVRAVDPVNGWEVDVWEMTTADVDLAVEIYNSVLAADLVATDPVVTSLSQQGIDLHRLLADPGRGSELVTRADIAEYAAAASVIATEGFTTGSMQMPNIPKMSRRKSDSGVDIFDVQLSATAVTPALVAGERLGLASVKHTVTTQASSLRLNIQKSISPAHELSQAYLAEQLRVVVGHLQAEGMAREAAQRTFSFMADFPDAAWTRMLGLAVVDPSLEDAMIAQMPNLPKVAGGHKFRIVTFPDLETVHLRCP